MVSEMNILPEISLGEKYQVLFAISSAPVGQLSKVYLERPGLLQISICSTGKESLNLAQKNSYDVFLSDYDLDDMDAINFHINLQNHGLNKPFLLFSITDRDREILNEFAQNPASNHAIEHDISIIFNEQAQKIAQSVELFRTRNRLELYTKHLEELVEERTRQLQIAQRFAVIGELATMIGHDMRNPLQVINNLQYLLDMKISKMTPDESSVLQKYGIPDIFRRIESEVRYLNKIVSDLQDYARDVNLEKSILCPDKFLEGLLEQISPLDTIIIEKKLESDIFIYVDPFLLTRVMNNLITNAIQAMEKGGVLTLNMYKVKDNLTITVSDTGVGILPEVQLKIFDPLYTTKAKGAGLGLSVSKRLIEALGGSIALTETSSKGSTFEVTLPIRESDSLQGEQ